ncbi:MAG TPA: DUF1080 domain-containing protein [Verrucomicrobiota bacterium]|nr:DUF1080 domain-containing protein [Verrucomicrobiota bacterium]
MNIIKTFIAVSGFLICGVVFCAENFNSNQTDGWRYLFDGKSTDNWRGYRKQTFPSTGWKVEDGCLKKIDGQRGGDIITKEQFENYELEWEWRIPPKANNGVKYFVTEQRPGAPGHEYQMIDDSSIKNRKQMTASFYDVLPPAEHKPIKLAPEWNYSRLVVNGNRVEHWLNGEKVLEYECGSPTVMEAISKSKFKNAEGFGKKIKGYIMLTDHESECWFRNIKIREIKSN